MHCIQALTRTVFNPMCIMYWNSSRHRCSEVRKNRSDAHPPPRIKMFFPFTRYRRCPLLSMIDVISLTPKRQVVGAVVVPSAPLNHAVMLYLRCAQHKARHELHQFEQKKGAGGRGWTLPRPHTPMPCVHAEENICTRVDWRARLWAGEGEVLVR